jgi:hypothetical protein
MHLQLQVKGRSGASAIVQVLFESLQLGHAAVSILTRLKSSRLHDTAHDLEPVPEVRRRARPGVRLTRGLRE